ncbi:free fatty acid receptor 2-like [Megalops cyprinoides]|uniref:free fatty acid receptor 2-like n=1 Tax=Megalops cyprinoides TaxID=118141 RepID=UPI0018642747|nr:free fatty acid receptor 2-like [Megalops cyprinoides]
MLTSHSQLVLSVCIITFLTGLPANALAFYTFCKKVKKKPTPIDILLLNLTTSDLIFLIFLPFKMKEAADNMLWKLPYTLCPITGFVFYSTIYNSTFFLTAVSVERYLGVAFPIRYKLYRRPLYTVVVSIFFWVLSSVNLSIVYIMPYYDPQNVSDSTSPTDCYREFTPKQLQVLLPVRLELCLLLFCVPFLISCFCYINFIRILSRLPNISRRRRLRAIGLALGTLLVFAFCFGPYNVSHVVGFATKRSPDWRHIALLFSTFNACLDPLIFYFTSSAMRSTFSHCLTGLTERLCRLHCHRPHCCPLQGPSNIDKYKEPGPHEGNACNDSPLPDIS